MSVPNPTTEDSQGPWRSHHRVEVMGTVITFDICCEADVSRQDLYVRVARARAALERADAVFSTWNELSPISQLRRGELTEAQAPADVAGVLGACEVARSMSDGWFDPWAVPGGVDPSGYVKGWAAQRALGELAMSGVTGALVNAAGDVAAFGRPGTGGPFRIAIADPAGRHGWACVVELAGALATSGTYERGSHLIDPRSGRPGARAASASVTGPDLGLADSLATALAVAGEEGLGFIERSDGYEGFVIGYDGARKWTPGFPFAPAGSGRPAAR